MSERERMFDARSIVGILGREFGGVAQNDGSRAERTAFYIMDRLLHRGWKTPEDSGEDASGDAMAAAADRRNLEQARRDFAVAFHFLKRNVGEVRGPEPTRGPICDWCGETKPGMNALSHWCSADCVDQARAFVAEFVVLRGDGVPTRKASHESQTFDSASRDTRNPEVTGT